MTEAPETVVVQLVMKREDGCSILDLPGPGTAGADPVAGNVTAERAEDIKALLAGLGLQVLEGNLNTLSVQATPKQLIEYFGIAPEAAATGVAAHATSIAPDLVPFVADVFIPQAPEFFP